jgi:hypothetical protein
MGLTLRSVRIEGLEMEMSMFAKVSFCFALVLALQPLGGSAATAPIAGPQRDGQHDFDFNLGGWKTHIRRLQHPLSGSSDWTELNGTVVINKIWDGKAQIEEIEADGPDGHFEGMTLFLYNPVAHQWGMYFANSSDGTVDQPGIGEFKDGRGEFYSQELYQGRSVLVRMVWSDIKADSHHVEQSFSVDGGQTWEPNFIGDLTRDNQAAAKATTPPLDASPQQHGFDWQLGAWNIHMSRMLHPLTGSTAWTPLDGTVLVRRVWGGRANLAEIETRGPSGHLQFLALRLYNPQSHQWNLMFANSDGGVLRTPALIGEFKDRVGVFYDQEPYNDRAILVRFTFRSLTADSSRDEEAFSADGGKTWEVNWINTQTRRK